jgi:hypothetical protein
MNETYSILFDTICDTLDDVLDDTAMVSVWLIVSEPHHAPTRHGWIPMNLNNAIVDLFS